MYTTPIARRLAHKRARGNALECVRLRSHLAYRWGRAWAPDSAMAKRDMAEAADEVYKGKPNPAG